MFHLQSSHGFSFQFFYWNLFHHRRPNQVLTQTKKGLVTVPKFLYEKCFVTASVEGHSH